MTKIFNAPPILVALNCADARERLQRCLAFAELIESFAIEPTYDGDHFTGLADRLPPIRVAAARA
jgi:hypothetical protein